ncbi:hypothetical protein BH11ACT8_BH11ACT8_14840 [soil metagenome]
MALRPLLLTGLLTVLMTGLLTGLVGGGSLVAPADADEPALSVTWPEVTSFNPDVYAYTFSLAYSGQEQLYAYDYSGDVDDPAARVPLPSSGEVDWTFSDDADGIYLVTCASSPCELLASAPALRLVRSVYVGKRVDPTFGQRRRITDRHVAFPLDVRAGADLEPVVHYAVVDAGRAQQGAVVARGESPYVDNAVSLGAITSRLVHGTVYELVVIATAEGEHYGRLASEKYYEKFVYDDQVDLRGAVDARSFFPVRDDFADESTLRLRLTEEVNVLRVTFTDRAGHTIDNPEPRGSRSPEVIRFVVGGPKIAKLRAGFYQWRVFARDAFGNTRRLTVPVHLSRRTVHEATYRHTFSAASTVLDRSVGRCSTLKRLRHGGLGYYSQTSCRRAAASGVSTVNGVFVPTSLNGHWTSLRITVNGGGAAGRRDAYAVLYYRDATGEFRARRQLDGRRGKHPGAVVESSDKLVAKDTASGRCYVVWGVGLTGGSRYDVQSYTVQITYSKL